MIETEAHAIEERSLTKFRLLDDSKGVEWDLGVFRVTMYTRDPKWIKIRDDKIYIHEWKEYRIKVHPPSEERVCEGTHVFFGDEEAEKDEGFWRYTFRNYIGKSRLRIYYSGQLILENDLDVISPKFTHLGDGEDVDNYIDFVESVRDELIKYSLELPFNIKALTEFQVEESYESISPLFAYHFFKNKNNREKIVLAYEHILSQPHRKLEELGEWVGLDEVATIDEDLIIGIVSRPELWRSSRHPHPLAEKMGGFIPEKFHQWEKYESLDTPENRFAKYFLDKMGFWLEEVLEWIRRVGNYAPALEEISDLQLFIEATLNSPIFSDVGGLQLFPSQSQVLLKREGYRDLLELWRLFNAYIPVFNEISEAIANKSVDKLYEYWCFFELVRSVEEVLGELEEIDVTCGESGEIVEGKAIARFENGFRLVYNRKFSRFKNGSYSVPLRPDCVLLGGNSVLVVFDAKFRFEDKFASLGVEDLERAAERARDAGDVELLAKLDDIFKMHTYRDALRTNAAVILYPGNVNKFFTIDGDVIEDCRNAMLRLILNNDLKGIGFLSFFPSRKDWG